MKKIFLLLIPLLLLSTGCWDRMGRYKMYNNVRLYYTSSVTITDVDNLGNLLSDAFKGERFSDGAFRPYKLDYIGDTYIIYAPVKLGMENEGYGLKVYELMAYFISTKIFHGFKVDINICDVKFNVRRTVIYAGDKYAE